MAKKLPPDERARTKTDFDAPDVAKRDDGTIKRKRGNPHGNPNGRPPSPTPRTSTLTIRLTDAEKLKLEEAARLTAGTKTSVIVEGIDYIYSRALAAERRRQRNEAAHGEHLTFEHLRK